MPQHRNSLTAPLGILLLTVAPLACAINGAQSREASVPPTDSETVSYSSHIRPVVENFCTTCHAGADPDGGFVLTGYDAVRDEIENGELLVRINDHKDPMPKRGLLPLEYRQAFQNWADQGFPREGGTSASLASAYEQYQPTPPQPIAIEQQGVEFLQAMQGHWVGELWLMGMDLPWFAFDYRAIGSSHVHGIFEGGTMGNLFNSFFIAELNGKKVLMARNGGVLNGIYRTSYFVMDRAETRADGSRFYRFADAIGGTDIMWMEVVFDGDQLELTSYTSRFGMLPPPELHMRLTAKRASMADAKPAADHFAFPSNQATASFPSGLPTPNWDGLLPITSASYIWQDDAMDLVEMGKISADPMRVDQIPYLAQLSLEFDRTGPLKDRPLMVYLSRAPLTSADGKLLTQFGYLREDVGNQIQAFPDIEASQNSFTFTYLHPGEYFLTVIADLDGDSYPSTSDITLPSAKIHVLPESHQRIQIPLTTQSGS